MPLCSTSNRADEFKPCRWKLYIPMMTDFLQEYKDFNNSLRGKDANRLSSSFRFGEIEADNK